MQVLGAAGQSEGCCPAPPMGEEPPASADNTVNYVIIQNRAALRSASYPRAFCPGSLLLLALVIRFRDPGRTLSLYTTERSPDFH